MQIGAVHEESKVVVARMGECWLLTGGGRELCEAGVVQLGE